MKKIFFSALSLTFLCSVYAQSTVKKSKELYLHSKNDGGQVLYYKEHLFEKGKRKALRIERKTHQENEQQLADPRFLILPLRGLMKDGSSQVLFLALYVRQGKHWEFVNCLDRLDEIKQITHNGKYDSFIQMFSCSFIHEQPDCYCYRTYAFSRQPNGRWKSYYIGEEVTRK